MLTKPISARSATMHNPGHISFRYLLKRLFVFLLRAGVFCAFRQSIREWKSYPTLFKYLILWITFITCLTLRLLLLLFRPQTTTPTLGKYFQFPLYSAFSFLPSLLFSFVAAPLPLPFPLMNNSIELYGINSGAFAWSTEPSARTLRLFVISWPWTTVAMPALKQRVNEARGIT